MLHPKVQIFNRLVTETNKSKYRRCEKVDSYKANPRVIWHCGGMFSWPSGWLGRQPVICYWWDCQTGKKRERVQSSIKSLNLRWVFCRNGRMLLCWGGIGFKTKQSQHWYKHILNILWIPGYSCQFGTTDLRFWRQLLGRYSTIWEYNSRLGSLLD